MTVPIVLGFAALATYWVIYTKTIDNKYLPSDVPYAFMMMFSLLIFFGGFLVTSYFRYLQRPQLRRVFRPVDTLDELEQLHFDSPAGAAHWLFHPHPQVRYAAARSIRSGAFDARKLARSLPYERVPLVREAQALALAAEPFDPHGLDDLFSGRVPEAAYIVEKKRPEEYGDERLQIANEVGHAQLGRYFSRYGHTHNLITAFENGSVGPHLASSTTRISAKSSLPGVLAYVRL